MVNYRVIYKDKVYEVIYVYQSGYWEIRDLETKQIELINAKDIQVIFD